MCSSTRLPAVGYIQGANATPRTTPKKYANGIAKKPREESKCKAKNIWWTQHKTEMNRGTKRANPPGWEQGNTFSRDKEEQVPEKQEEVELVHASST